MKKPISRRNLLRGTATLGLMGGMTLMGCAAAPQTVIQTVEVEKVVEQKVVETVIVEVEKAVEQKVVETVFVDKEKIVEVEVIKTPALAAAAKDTFIYGMNSAVRTMDPIKTISSECMALHWNMYDTLASFDPPYYNLFMPRVATSWETSPDASEFTFHLRDDIKFTSGNKLTAHDVAFSVARGIYANYPVYGSLPSFLDPDNIEVLDDYTIRFTLTNPFAGFVAFMANPKTSIIDKKTLEPQMSAPMDNPESDFGTPYLDENSLGSAQFKLKTWERNKRVVLERNEGYWGPAPKLTYLIDLHVADPTTQRFMLQRGDIDMARDMTTDMAMEFLDYPNPDISIYKTEVFQGTGINMNPHPGTAFADKNARNAVKWAINYQEIIDKLAKGNAIRLSGPIFKGLLGAQPEKDYYYYDPERAKEYLAMSGHPNGFEFTINFGTGAGTGIPWETLVVKEQSDLAKIGITMKLEQVDWPIMDNKLFAEGGGDYEAEQMWFGLLFADPEACWSLMGRPKTGIVLGPSSYTNDAMDEASLKAATEPDIKKREQMYFDLNEWFADDGPFAFCYQPVILMPMRSNVKGYDYNAQLTQINWHKLYKE